MEEVTLGSLAEEQAKRHPLERPGRGGPSRVSRSSWPLIQSGRALASRRGIGGDVETVPLVTQAAFGRLALRTGRMKTAEIDIAGGSSKRVEAARLREGDVVLSLARPFQVALVGPGAGAIVPVGFAIVRMDPETASIIDPAYLTGWLSSSFVRDELLPSRADGRFAMVDELYTVSVPVLPLGVQRLLGDLVRAQMRAEVTRWEGSEADIGLLDDMYAHEMERWG